MKLNDFTKGLIMALVGFVATTLSSLETFNIIYVLLSTVGFTLVYVAKNYVFPSVSAFGIDFKDIISGVILAVGMGVVSYVAQILTTGFEWGTLWLAVSGAVVGYFLKTLPTDSTAEIKK